MENMELLKAMREIMERMEELAKVDASQAKTDINLTDMKEEILSSPRRMPIRKGR
jgi:hypothetical protein